MFLTIIYQQTILSLTRANIMRLLVFFFFDVVLWHSMLISYWCVLRLLIWIYENVSLNGDWIFTHQNLKNWNGCVTWESFTPVMSIEGGPPPEASARTCANSIQVNWMNCGKTSIEFIHIVNMSCSHCLKFEVLLIYFNKFNL